MYRKDWISKWAIYSPDKVAVSEYETNQSITYKKLNCQANYLSNRFLNTGCTSNDRVLVIAEHSIAYVALFSMAQKTGITLVPVNYRLSAREIEYLIADSNPSYLIAEKKFEQLIPKTAEAKLIWMEELAQELEAAKDTEFEALEIDENHPLFILYTSGTTGYPKGAIYSHKMLFWNSVNTSQSLELTPSDHTVSCMPAFHTGGWNVLLTPLLHKGASVGIMKKFDPDQVLKLLEKEKSQLFMGVPTMLKMMAESEQFESADLSNLRYFIVGGEALPLNVIHNWHNKGVKIRQGYGLTEVGPNLTSLHQDHVERKIGSIGLPNFYTEIKLKTSNGKEAQTNEIGELCLSGSLVTPGYWNNKNATEEAIQDGWFHTGDLAKMDDEGFLYIVDRIKCMFISGGENVYPAEVERVLRQLPEVDEAAVVGVVDVQWGEVGKAYLTATNGKMPDEDVITAHCAKHLAKFKVPKQVVWLDEMPKTDSGKIDRKKLNT